MQTHLLAPFSGGFRSKYTVVSSSPLSNAERDRNGASHRFLKPKELVV